MIVLAFETYAATATKLRKDREETHVTMNIDTCLSLQGRNIR